MADAPRKKRMRRTAEERLADLERKKQEFLVRQEQLLAKLEAQQRRLSQTPALRKERIENQKRLYRALAQLAPHWDERQVIAAVEKCLSEDTEAMATRGAALLAEHGKSRRGRKPKNG